MQAIILAAGLGTRMGELTKTTPKPLLKIAGKAILEHNLAELPDEIKEVFLVVGYLGRQIRKLVGENIAGKKISYVEQQELKGTAHALFACKNLLRGRFLVVHGDDLYHKRDLERLIKHPLAVLVWPLRERQDNAKLQGGVVKVNEAGEVIDIVEREPASEGALVNTGAYVLNKELFKYGMASAGKPATEFGLPQTLLQMIKGGAKFAVVPAEKWHKIATPEDLKL